MPATTRNVRRFLLSSGLPAPRLRQAGGRIATDPLARLKGTWLLNSAEQTLNYHGYNYNLRNDITRHTRTDASFVDYDYDDLGQLTDAVGSGGQSGENLVYGYDAGWNMIARGVPRVDITSYTVNDRNQVTGMTGSTTLGYDAHGNLLGQDNWDQQWGMLYTYDAENRLTRVEEDTFYNPNALRTEFVYDGLSRLRIRREYLYASGWALTGETRYLYDGRRVIQERSSANTPTVSYTRGNDLSGSLEGAGGIGGMLARSHGYSGSTGAWSTHNYYHADAGGNITCLINSNNGITAIYRYDPFGRTLFQSGTMASANGYRFSSKEVHGFTGMYYYGFRFYDPGLQRWINRDPIGEVGGLNLYGFVRNKPIGRIDPLGLDYYGVQPLWCGGSDVPYYYGDTFLEDLAVIPYNTGAAFVNTVEGILAFGNWALENALGHHNAEAAGMLMFKGAKLPLVKHHSIPRATLRQLPPPVRNHPDVRGRRGNPNRKQVPEDRHKASHSSPPGDYFPGGDYNRRIDELIRERGGYDAVSPSDLNDIRDQVMCEFGL